VLSSWSRSDGSWARRLSLLLLVVLLWLGLCAVALLFIGAWPRTPMAWFLVIGLGPPVVLFGDMLGEILMSPVRSQGRGVKMAVLLLVSIGAIVFATWAKGPQSLGHWWGVNFGGG
jgi:hypothetical protein